MTKEQTVEIERLSVYAVSLREKLSASTPNKHLKRVESYRRFITNELDVVVKQIQEIKLGEK